MTQIFEDLFKNRKVFVTGHTGFIGSWLTQWLCNLGAKVVGYSLKPPTNPSLFEDINLEKKLVHIIGNINDQNKLQQTLQEHSPEFLFHLAAQPLVKTSYDQPVETIQTNIIGTTNLLESIKKTSSVKVCVVVTSDKCYENKEINYAYKETDALGGYDPYSASKAAVEIISSSYRNSFFNPNNFTEHGVSLATSRIGNVIGGGDWAEDRLVPDIMRSLSKNHEIHIRNPSAVRPWQHVLEAISGLFCLSKKMRDEPTSFAQPWNFGPLLDNENLTVSQLNSQIISEWGSGNHSNISGDAHHEANLLMLDSSKAINKLNWYPVYSVKEAISKTVTWYKEYFTNKDQVEKLTQNQISEYVDQAKKMNLRWATNI